MVSCGGDGAETPQKSSFLGIRDGRKRFPGPCVAGSNPARPALTSSRPPFPLVTPDFERDLLDLASAVGFLLGMDQGATSEREVRENVARIIESFDF
jgi:hypothetical protein